MPPRMWYTKINRHHILGETHHFAVDGCYTAFVEPCIKELLKI